MKCLFILLLITSHSSSHCQRIDFRNDSLFINNFYINQNTAKRILDSLLEEKGKLKIINAKFFPGTRTVIRWQKIKYPKRRIHFSTKLNDSLPRLSITIKLHRYKNPEIERGSIPVKPFKGNLYIGHNYMNDKLTLEQLQGITNCTLQYKVSNYNGRT